MKCSHRRSVALALAACVGAVVPLRSALADLSSFAGAQGFGDQTTGGRAGSIYVVTNLNDSGAGSFRDAVSQSNRIVVFAVSGYINLSSAISAKSNLTILGQTAPGQGVSTHGRELSFSNQNNIILQYFRARQGSIDPGFKDSINIGNTTNVILDHDSVEFAQYNNIDDVYSVTGGQGVYQNVLQTIQNTIMADPIPGQQFNLHQEGSSVTYLNNIWANAHNRNPLAKGSTQYVNNTVYDYQAGYTTGNSSGTYNYDIINNFFIAGKSTSSPSDAFYQLSSTQHSYAVGNLLDSNKDGTLSGSTLTPGGGTALTSAYYAQTQFLPTLGTTASVAFNLAHSGDAYWSGDVLTRDAVDAQVLSQVASYGTSGTVLNSETGTGLSNGGFGDLGNATIVGNGNYLDTVPLTWLTTHGLSTTNVSGLLLKNPLGYDMIEQYAMEVSDQYGSMVVAAGDYNSLSYPATSPAIYTHLLVRGTNSASGSLTISSVDTAAGAFDVSIGGNGLASGETLNITGGALAVQDTVYVGDQNNGTFNLSGGTVRASNVQLGKTVYDAVGNPTSYTGTFNLSGGVLQVDEVVRGAGTPGSWTTGGVWNWSGGTIQAYTGLLVSAPANLTGSGATFNTLGPDGVAYDGDVTGVLSGTAGVTKIGGGTLTFSANNTYAGNTTISGGALLAASNKAFSNGTIFANAVNGLQLANGVTISNKITANAGANEFEDIPSANTFATLAGNISGTGSQFRIGISGANSVLNLTGASTATNLTLITRGGITFSGNGSLVNTSQAIIIGRGGNTSTVNLTVKDNALVQGVGITLGGLNGTSDSIATTVTLAGNGIISAGTSSIDVSNNDVAGTVALVLNGGTLKGGSFTMTGNNRGATTLTFNGGTILATAGDGATPFFPALGSGTPTAVVAKISTSGLKVDDGGFNISIAQPMINAFGVDGGLTKIGNGTLSLTGANTYNGTTTVSTGALKLDFAPLLTTTDILLSTGTASITGGATLVVNGNASTATSQTLGALNFGTGQTNFIMTNPGAGSTVTLTNITRSAGSGAILTIPTGAQVNTPLGTAGNVLTVNNTAVGLINGDWTAKDPTNTFIVPGGSISGFYTPNPLDGGNNSVSLSGNIDMVNPTASDLANQTRIAGNNFIGVVRFDNPGNFSITVKSGAFLATQGVLVTANAGVGTFNIDAIRSNGAGDLTVWQNDTASPLTFGTIGNNSTTSLNKNGPGMLIINSAGGYTGQTYLNGGITSINTDGAIGDSATAAPLNLNGGTLQADGTFALSNGAPGTNDRPVVLASLNGTIDVTPGNTFTVAGNVSGPGTLTKTNTGTLVLSGSNTYSGNTTVSAGALYVNNTSGAGTGAGSVILNGGTLGGTGTLFASVITGSSPHTINPGSSGTGITGGTLTIGGNLTTNPNTTIAFDLVAPGNSNAMLAVNGNLAFGGGTIAISSHTATGAASLGYYRAIDYTGALPAGINTLTLPAIANNIAYTLDTTIDPGFIDIHRGFIGDANDSGSVDLTDLNIVLNNLGAPTTSWTLGNFDGAATIDLTDLNDVLNQLGVSIPAGASAIAFAEALTGTTAAPEPASLSLLAFGAAALIARRRTTRPSSNA